MSEFKDEPATPFQVVFMWAVVTFAMVVAFILWGVHPLVAILVALGAVLGY